MQISEYSTSRYNLFTMVNYSILWITPTYRFIYYGGDTLDGLISIVECWYKKCPRIEQKPKIICNRTGRIVYE